MCGIGAVTGEEHEALGARIRDALRHRGPDGSGLVRAGGCTLASTRLAIVDPAPRSIQPMRAGRVHLVYNGELYNAADLRARLAAEGAQFRTTGDTEVVLNAFCRWGPGCLRELRGMFALACWDDERSELLLARDPCGIKPLYWRPFGDGHLAVASETKALLGSGGASVRDEAVQELLRFGSVVTATAFHEVHELAPGSALTWRPDGIEISSLPAVTRPGATDLGEAVAESVAAHLVSDRPIGVFLSGGFDSVVVLAAARAAGADPLALTLDTGHNGEDVAWARKAAAYFGARHVVVPVPEDQVAERFSEFVDAMDQPTVDGFNTFLLAQAARARDVPVVLTGMGGDELFGGYSYYRSRPLLRGAAWASARLPERAQRAVAGTVAASVRRPRPRVEAILRARGAVAEHRAWRTIFTEDECRVLTGGAPGISAMWSAGTTPPAGSGAAGRRLQFTALDYSTYLRPTLLRDADVFSMASGVELRVPLVDREVIAAARAEHHPRTKPDMARRMGEPLLRQVAARPKRTFALPWRTWLPELVHATGALRRDRPWADMVDPEAGRRVFAEAAGWRTDPMRAYALIVLARWLERHDKAVGSVR